MNQAELRKQETVITVGTQPEKISLITSLEILIFAGAVSCLINVFLELLKSSISHESYLGYEELAAYGILYIFTAAISGMNRLENTLSYRYPDYRLPCTKHFRIFQVSP